MRPAFQHAWLTDRTLQVKASEAINAQSKTKAQRKLERTAPLVRHSFPLTSVTRKAAEFNSSALPVCSVSLSTLRARLFQRATKKLILEKEKARKAQRKDKKKQPVVVPRAAGAGEEAAAKPKKKGVSFA